MRQISKARIWPKRYEHINEDCFRDIGHCTGLNANIFFIPSFLARALVSLCSLYCFTIRSSVIIKNRLNPFNASSVFNLRKQNAVAKTRNVVLKIKTYDRLEQYKVELVKRKRDPKVTYDDVINDLLDNMLKPDLQAPQRK